VTRGPSRFRGEVQKRGYLPRDRLSQASASLGRREETKDSLSWSPKRTKVRRFGEGTDLGKKTHALNH